MHILGGSASYHILGGDRKLAGDEWHDPGVV